MDLLNIDALRRARLSRDPFDFLVVPSFMSADGAEQLNRDYAAIDKPRNYRLDELEMGASSSVLCRS